VLLLSLRSSSVEMLLDVFEDGNIGGAATGASSRVFRAPGAAIKFFKRVRSIYYIK
jgi:hypothetical protein